MDPAVPAGQPGQPERPGTSGWQRQPGRLGRAGPPVPEAQWWNHNIHYHPLILGAVPDGCQRALDVGCGDGLLARRLSRIVPDVWAIDSDGPTLALARRRDAAHGVTYLHGDFLTHEFGTRPFGMIVSVAALHHMDAGAALRRMRDLLAPGGTLVVVGLARSRPVGPACRWTWRGWPRTAGTGRGGRSSRSARPSCGRHR